MIKCANFVSSPLHTNHSIIECSGVGPTLYIIMESDLKTLSCRSLFCKYADNMNVIVSDNYDNGLNDECINTRARANEMIMSLSKTKEIVFRRPDPRHFMNPPPINNVEHVDLVNLLGILLSNNFCCDAQVGNVLKM